MKWIYSKEDLDRIAEEKRVLRAEALEDLARARRSKDQKEKDALMDSAYRRLDEAKNKI